MYTIIDYLNYYKDLDLAEATFNKIDDLLFAILVYLPVEIFQNEITLEEFYQLAKKYQKENIGVMVPKAYELLEIINNSKRYRNLKITNFIKRRDSETQFGAATFILEDKKIISFKGTDGSLIGWIENIRISYKYLTTTQQLAVSYLKDNIKEQDKAIYVTGHSKGGNLALVSAMELDDFLLKKIVAVDNFDGPGLRLEEYNSLKYKKVLKKLNNIVPSMSCVGILLNNSNYQVVASNLFAFEQHYPTSWNVFGQVFVPNELAKSSVQLHESTTAGVENLNQEKIEYAFETLFTNLGKEYTKPVKVTMEDIKNILKNMKNIDREVYSYIETILSAMISVSYKDSDLEVL